jgi:hypothetical protein
LRKDLPEFRQAIEGVGVTSMTIGPVVIAEDINQGVFERLKQLVPLGKERIRAWA